MTVDRGEPLDPALYREIVRRALAEDIGWGDVTSERIVPRAAMAAGRLTARAPSVVAGLDVATEAFRQLDPSVSLVVGRGDGERCAAGDTAAEWRGLAVPMFTAGQTAFAFAARLSGIATLTRQFVDVCGPDVAVVDTRITTPTLRALEKYAVRVGGGRNHRMTLDDGVLVSRDHARFAGSLASALLKVVELAGDLPIDVEVGSLDEADEAMRAGATRLIAVGFDRTTLSEVVRRSRGRATVTVSGRLTLAQLVDVAAARPDAVAASSLTQAAPWAEFDLGIRPAT